MGKVTFGKTTKSGEWLGHCWHVLHDDIPIGMLWNASGKTWVLWMVTHDIDTHQRVMKPTGEWLTRGFERMKDTVRTLYKSEIDALEDDYSFFKSFPVEEV